VVRDRLVRDAHLCELCGGELDHGAPARSKRAPTADHIIPVSLMVGMDPRAAQQLAVDPSNLRVCCYSCNASRGNGRRDRPRHVSREW
jgi:5-methylcytosine-specific restriction endonuclease McrA